MSSRSEYHLRESPEARIPTSHTIGRAIKELSHEDLKYKSLSGNVFRFNTNPRLNDLLMKLNMKMGLFKSGQTVNVDFDADMTILPVKYMYAETHCIRKDTMMANI